MESEIRIIALSKEQSQALNNLFTWMSTVESRLAKRNLDEWYTDAELMKKFGWSKKQMQIMRSKGMKGIDYIRTGGTFIYRYETINKLLMSQYITQPRQNSSNSGWNPKDSK